VSVRGIGNRPGAAQMNSGFRWPYGRRESVLPVWAQRRAAAPGAGQFHRVIFQNRKSEGFASRTSVDSTLDQYFCLAFDSSTTKRDQLDAVKQFLSTHGLREADLYPMVRGRVVALNGQPVNEAQYTEERARRLVEREFNLSYMEAMPAHNTLAAGRWTADGLSVEEGIAQRLGWNLGDRLTFNVGGETFTAPITSLRRVRWDSMKVNFFVIAPPGVMEKMPTSYISAFRVPPAGEAALNQLAAQFPNLTLVDIGAALKQAQDVADQLIAAVQFIFLFALGAGLLVLYSALVATEDERRREAAVMRVYGASRAQVAGAQRVEFLAMGLTAGVLAALGAAVIGQLLARRVFELDLPPSLALLIAGPLAGLALLSLNAWLSSRKVLRASPALTLRESI